MDASKGGPAARARRRRDWLGVADDGGGATSETQPLGYLLARALLLSALMRCERGDLKRAERRLNSAERLMPLLPSPKDLSHDIIVERRQILRSLVAGRLEVRARIQLSRGDRKGAMRLFEESLGVSEDAAVAFQIASLRVDEAEDAEPPASSVAKAAHAIGHAIRKDAESPKALLAKADHAIEYARRIDFRDLYETKLKKLEDRLEKLRAAKSPNAKPSKDGDGRAGSS